MSAAPTASTPVPAQPAPPQQAQLDAYSSRRERIGWYFYDWGPSAFRATVVTVFLGPYLGSVADRAADSHGRVHPLGISVASGSLYAYTVSLSVLLTVFVLPVIGALADRSAHKKQLLASCAFTGAAATIGLLFLSGTRYLLGALLFLLANVAYGASAVVYNSFLPQLAGPDQRDRVSSIGWATGYIGGGLVLLLNLVALSFKGTLGLSTAEVARYSIAAAGLWWALFTILPLRRLRNRPPHSEALPGSALTAGFRQLGHTLRHMGQLPLTIFFLVAYLIYNDGIQTVITLASVYADKQLHLAQSVQVTTILIVQFVAFGGGYGIGKVAQRVGAWKTVLGTLVVWTAAIGLAYALPVGKALPFIGLGVLIGIVLGGSQALTRSLFSQLIPVGREAEYFGIYQISADGTSWLGPLLFGIAYQISGTYRTAISSLLVFFVLGFVCLLLVPIRKAIVAAGNTPPRLL